MTSQHTWIRLASYSGMASILCYLGAAFLPLPDVIGRLLAFAFGPLLIASFLGIYRNNMVRTDLLSAADTEAAREAINLEWNAVNRVQYLLDVVWDIFLCAALILFGTALLGHPQFGKIWGAIGIVVSGALLLLNLYTFPEGPAYAGSVDLGPLAALWMMAVFVRMLYLSIKSESPAARS